MTRTSKVNLQAPRLRLHTWRDDHRDAFAAMHGDPDVMWDATAPLSRAESDAKLDRYRAAQDRHGFSRMAIEDTAGRFLGYVGLLPIASGHPLGEGAEIGWRLRRDAWGHGYASEGAAAVLADARDRLGLSRVYAFTAPDNLRSQAVMTRIGLLRDEALDFTQPDGWRGWVWRTA